jgi:hypothetical protein
MGSKSDGERTVSLEGTAMSHFSVAQNGLGTLSYYERSMVNASIGIGMAVLALVGLLREIREDEKAGQTN